MRLLDRRCHHIWLAVVRGLPRSLDWLFARSCCACAAPLTALFTWREPDRRGARWLPTPLCGVAKALPPLAKVWEGRLYEAQLSRVGLRDDGLLRLLTGLRVQPHTRLLNISYNHFTSVGLKALTNGLMHEGLMPKLEELNVHESGPNVPFQEGVRYPNELTVDAHGIDHSELSTDEVWAWEEKEEAEWDAAMGTFERSERCLALKKWDNGLD